MFNIYENRCANCEHAQLDSKYNSIQCNFYHTYFSTNKEKYDCPDFKDFFIGKPKE